MELNNNTSVLETLRLEFNSLLQALEARVEALEEAIAGYDA